MLTMMRNMLRSKAAGGLFVILIIAMAAWGVTDIFAGGAGSGLISSGDRVVTDRQFDTSVERVLINAEDAQGRSLTKEQALDQGIIDQVFSRKQTETLLTAYADRLGVSATKDAIDNEIRTSSFFQDDTGLYDANLYLSILDANSIRPADYRDNVEIELTIERLRELPITGLKAPSLLARLQAAYEGERRSASYFTLRQSELAAIPEPTEDALQALYTERQSALRIPERRALSLVRMGPEDFVSTADVSDQDIAATYEAYKASRYTGPDSRRYTTFRFSDEASARAALGRIAGGAAASTIETAVSTAEQTGPRETLANERLSEQVFGVNAQIGSIHGPQPDAGGFLVIRLEEIIPGESIPLESVREEIRTELARAQAANQFYEMLPQFDDLLGTGADLESVAKSLGVPLLSFAPVDVSGRSESGQIYTALTESPKLLNSAFNQPAGNQTERFILDETTWLARVDVIEAERVPEFEEVRDELVFFWTQQEQQQQLQRVAGEIEIALNEGSTTLAEQATLYQDGVEAFPRPITRAQATQAQLPSTLINALFAANREGEVFSAPGLPGQQIILQVTQIDQPAAETLDLLAEGSVATLQGALAEDLYAAYFVAIRDEVELEINQPAFTAYKQSLRLEP